MSDDVEGMLRAAVTAGPWPVAALKEVFDSAGVTRWQLERAVASLKRDGELVTVVQHFWAGPEFQSPNRERDFVLWVDGFTRADLIRRVSSRAPSAVSKGTSTSEIMQGDDADRLAREAGARGEW